MRLNYKPVKNNISVATLYHVRVNLRDWVHYSVLNYVTSWRHVSNFVVDPVSSIVMEFLDRKIK